MSDDLAHKDCGADCQDQDSDCGAKNTVQKEGRESDPDRLFADKKEARRELKELARGFAADYLAKHSPERDIFPFAGDFRLSGFCR